MTASTVSNTEPSQTVARLTGSAYFGIIVSGIFAEFFVRMNLVEVGDAARTAANIAGSALLFRAGLAADVLMIALDVGVAVGLYSLLRHVNRPLALLAAALRLIQAAVLGANLMNMTSALQWATRSAAPGGLDPSTAQSMLLASLELHRVVYDLGLVFFGLACLVLGQLLRASRVVPRLIGVGLSVAGAVYLVGSFAVLFAPEWVPTLEPMYGLALIAELAIAGWLVLKGFGAGRTTLSVLPLAALVLLSACGDASDAQHDDAKVADNDAGATVRLPVRPLSDYADPGEHDVGFRIFELRDAESTVKAWYPTDEVATPVSYEVSFKADYYGAETGEIRGRATRDALLANAEAPFPLVVLSHGFSMNPEWYSSLAEHLASRGFVVLAPEHDEGDWDATVIAATLQRPEDVRDTLDLAERLDAKGEWQGLLDLANVAALGHSYGGYTALAAAGARFDIDGLADRCDALDAMDPKGFLCAPFVKNPDAMKRLSEAASDPSALRDERVTAVVTIAGDAYLFGENGLATVNVPTLAIGGTGDNWSPWDWGAELTYDFVGSERAALVGLEHADHMIAINTCDDMPWTNTLPEDLAAMLCQDPSWDRQEALGVIRSFVTAFLLNTLAGDTTAGDSMSRGEAARSDVLFRASW